MVSEPPPNNDDAELEELEEPLDPEHPMLGASMKYSELWPTLSSMKNLVNQ